MCTVTDFLERSTFRETPQPSKKSEHEHEPDPHSKDTSIKLNQPH